MARRLGVPADTSDIIALLDSSDRHHSEAVTIFQSNSLLIPATVQPEVDYLTRKYLGELVAKAFLQDLTDGYFEYLSVHAEDIKRALEIIISVKLKFLD